MLSKSFTDLFIRKPVIALVVNIVILVVGVVSYFKLNTRQYPRSDSAVVNVSTVYFGASADTVRGYITTQLERVIASADGIDYIESESRAGFSSIKVYLRLNYDTNAALAQISAKIDQVRGELPPESEAPTISVETADNQFASMYLSFYSDKSLSQCLRLDPLRVEGARRRLLDADLIAYQKPDYQVLSLPQAHPPSERVGQAASVGDILRRVLGGGAHD